MLCLEGSIDPQVSERIMTDDIFALLAQLITANNECRFRPAPFLVTAHDSLEDSAVLSHPCLAQALTVLVESVIWLEERGLVRSDVSSKPPGYLLTKEAIRAYEHEVARRRGLKS